MKRKSLLIILLLALMVPLAALAQVERTATVYNGWDKECHVPMYGNLNDGDRSLSQFIMDKSVLQAMGLAGKQITKMTFYLANPVPASYQWTTPRYTYVTLAEVDASELDENGNVIQSEDMTNEQIVTHLYLDAQGETMEIAFSSPYTYSGEKNLLVQFEEQYQFYPSGYTPFGPYRKPVFYGVYKDGASGWNKVTYTGGHPTRLVKYNFVPKTTFTYLDEATWANTNRPQNVTATPSYDIGNNNSISYRIQLQWDAPANYTGNYQVLCVPRGTSTLDWSNPIATSNTFYTFEGLQKNTSYDLYVRAKRSTNFFNVFSAAATASATTPFYPANLDEGDLVFDFNSRTMPNGLTLAGNATYLVRPYSDHNYSLNRLGYYNVGAGVGSFDWMGRQHYLETSPLTITLPDLKFTNASNGLMVDFDLIREEVYYDAGPAQVLVKLHDYNYNEDLFSATASTDESYYDGQHFTYRITNVDQSSSQHIYKLSFSSVDGGKGFTIDNIVVRKAPAIIPAYNLAASEITPNSATISWTDDNTNSHTFDLVYRQKGYSNDPNIWEHYVEGVTNPYTLTGLTPYTDYEVKVKTITSSAYEDSEIFGFSTQCTPALAPYYEPFAGLTALPTDWRVNVPEYAEVVMEVGNGRLTLHNTATEVTHNTYGYISTYTSYSEFGAYIILPYFNNLGSLQLSFKAGRTQGTMESLSVGVVADPNNYTDYTEIGTATLTDNANGEVYSYNLVNNAVQSGHIVIYFGKYESNLQSIWLDDFYVQQYAAPTGPVVSNVTNTTATLGWNAGAATEWEVQYKLATASDWTTVTPNPTTNTCTITGLTASTDYVAQVRAKYGDSPSTWVGFGTFRTLMQEAVVMDASHSNYSQNFNFINIGHGWMFLNVPRVNSDDYGWYWGNIGTTYSSKYCIYISDDGGTSNNYYVGSSYEIGSTHGYLTFNETTVYAAKTFNLAPGQYTFNYDYRVKGVVGQDYARVALVPADVALEGIYAGRPDGLTSTTLPEGWIALDDETALPQYGTTATWSTKTVTHSVFAPGDYMMVFIWHQDAGSRLHSAVQMPIAIDNVSVTWSPLITPPDMSTLVAAPTDTQATLTWSVPTCTLTPTGYEVEYATDASFTDALTATTNTNSVTLTGLTANTNYYVRIRSAHTANGTTIYSDWSDACVFSTNYPTPTNFTLVRQTTSMAQVMWTPVEMTLPEEQRINYTYQLTTDPDDWGADNPGLSSNGWERNLAPGSYHFRVKTAVYDNSTNTIVGESSWSEPIQFTIAPWTDPVTLFPLTYGFETPTYFDDGLTLGGNLDKFSIARYELEGLTAHDGEANIYLLAFTSGSNGEAYLVMPPLRPSTNDALVSFWWYHDNTANNTDEGVTIEQSSNGASWQQWGSKITRYAEETGWVKYQQVVPAGGTDPIYIRLHFEGANSGQWWKRCYLDDLTVNTFKSEQPYISYVGCDGNSATITLYDYAVENGYHSSQFEVQYREWRDPSETQETWVDYDVFVNQEPYTFETTLTVNGLQPATCYEFRARARVSFGGYDFDWSGYCEPVRQWTDCGTYTITPTYSYTEDFEELFNGTDCWTVGEGWEIQHEGGHSGDYCAYLPANTNSKMTMPLISASGCNNVIIRFWSKGPGKIYAYYGQDFGTSRLVGFMSNTTDWVQYELSISYLIKNNALLKISFEPDLPYRKAWYVDDIEIVANAYDKVFDPIGASYVGAYEANSLWFPNGVPTAEDNVMIMGSAKVGFSETTVVNAAVGNVAFSHHGSLSVNKSATLTANRIDATKQVTVYGTANITTLNATKANSAVVKNGGTLYAATITGTSDEVDNTVVIEDGGQLKLDNPAYVTVKKTIGSYTAIEAENNVERGGYYLISSPLNTNYFNPAMAGACTQVTEGGETVWTYDLYAFDYEQELEWRNYKVQNFLMRNGRGYLYANRDGVDLSFAGPVAANNTPIPYSTNYGEGASYPLNGWTLVGNPFTCNAYISGSAPDMAFFRMNPAGDGFIPVTGPLAPMEGVFVYTQTAGQVVTFSREESTTNDPNLTIDPNIMALPIHILAENQDALLMVAQTIALVEGWNWWAPMVRITAAQLRATLNSNLQHLMTKTGEVATDAVLEPGQMYKIQTEEAVDDVTITGVPTTASISVGDDINWIGYTGERTNISAALAPYGIEPSEGDKIISQEGGFAIYNGTTWTGTLIELEQGKGYIYVRGQ